MAWANGTRCALTEDVREAWVWRKQCMVGLLMAAVATGRTALVHQAMGAVYNLGHIQRWCVDTRPHPLSPWAYCALAVDENALLDSLSSRSVWLQVPRDGGGSGAATGGRQ